MAVVAASSATISSAQLGVGGAPTGHRHQLKPVPPRPRPAPGGNGTQFGDPLVGLSAAEQAAFAAGREEFESVETAEDGLGPIFNNNSCAACHSTPLSGGASTITETRFGRSTRGQFDPLAELGGSLMQQFATVPAALEHVPREANVTALRLTTPLFGAGLIEAITDADIAANAARRRGDGVSGRVSRVIDPVSGTLRVGRFGWKAQQATLLAFAGEAYRNENGITNDLFPDELATGIDPALLDECAPAGPVEDVVDPASGRRAIDDFANFMRMLAPPPRGAVGPEERRGEGVFRSAGCASCHVPTMLTGPSDDPALDRKPVPLFSDLLLHDVGTGDGIPQDGALANEVKTPPLWGLRFRRSLLHDGRAGGIAEAIDAHGGQARAARDRYVALPAESRAALLAFLRSL